MSSNLSRSSVAPRAAPKRSGKDSDDEEDDGKTTEEEENEINRIMGRNQPQPQRKGALSLAERAQQRVLMASGLPAVPKTILQDILSSPNDGPRASTLPPIVPRLSARPPSPQPMDEETRKRKEAEKKSKRRIIRKIKKGRRRIRKRRIR